MVTHGLFVSYIQLVFVCEDIECHFLLASSALWALGCLVLLAKVLNMCHTKYNTLIPFLLKKKQIDRGNVLTCDKTRVFGNKHGIRDKEKCAILLATWQSLNWI